MSKCNSEDITILDKQYQDIEENEISAIDYELKQIENEIQKLEDRKKILVQRKEKLRDDALLRKSLCVSRKDWNKEDFNWSKDLKNALKDVFKIEKLRDLQLPTMNAVMSNEDVILIMPTGGGKSLCYQLPAVVSKGVPVLGLTATAPAKIIVDVQKMLDIQGCLVLRTTFNRPNLFYEVRRKPADKSTCLAMIENLLKSRFKDKSGIIYTTTIKDAEQLTTDLRALGLKVGCYHAMLEAEYRSEVYSKWISGKYQAVVATIAFGLGIDKPDVRFVIHHCISKSIENFYQESGRAGRDGKKSACIVLYRLPDVFKLSTMVFQDKVGLQNLYKMLAYCLDMTSCRRSLIATHFEETWAKSDCAGMCDHCRKSNILKKASSYILGDCNQDNRRTMYQDGEALFCKNNVCVHPPTLMRQNSDVIHHPGYMAITCRFNKNSNVPTLHLSWIPNSTLRKHPTTLENLNTRKFDCNIYRDVDMSSHHSQISEESYDSKCEYENTSEKVDVCLEVKEPVSCGDCERVCSGGFPRNTRNDVHDTDSTNDNRGNLCNDQNVLIPETKETDININLQMNYSQSDSSSVTIHEENDHSINLSRLRSESLDCKYGENQHCKYQKVEIQDTDGKGTDEELKYPYCDDVSFKSRSMSLTSTCSLSVGAPSEVEEIPSWMRSPELLALQHNLTFPESATASPVTLRRAHKCRRFSVDLSEMRSLRLFFADPACTSGQLVVASRESQYKILHFHHGGLDRLATTLHQWHQLLYPRLDAETEETLPYRHFMVCRPEVSRDELHPEEGQVPMITSLAWKDLLNERGQVEDDLALRKGIFFGGLEPALRKIVWPFLLHCYSYQSTYDDREQIDAIRRQEYEEIQKRRLNMNPEQAEHFWRNVVCIVEKDVVRTDRGNPYYAGEDNPNIEVMKNILLNYAVYNSRLGYTQGMSDLLAPLLAELNSEIEAFWCFAGLMQRSVAVCTPTDIDMDRNLCYLRELVRIMVPNFYAHLQKHTDALELLFCHRWILLCLKREFPTEVALVMWEACWVNYLTDHFHLFLCLAIMCVYADDVIAQDLRTDEMLLHFSSLAMYMDGNLILRKARGLLHHFRQLVRLPCTLAGLCRQCGPGMWDSTHDPVIECIGHDDAPCPYLNNYE